MVRGIVVGVLVVVMLSLLLVSMNGIIPLPKPKPDGEKKLAPGLSWEENHKFREIQQQYNTPLLVADYRATLPDPIFAERHNIGLAAEYLQGTVVGPGEMFSLNERLGGRTEERGFRPGPMYLDGAIVSTIGGGVCKIASLLYNVVVLANLEVVERHPHSMLVPYVPPGQDATISYSTKDFRFRNNDSNIVLLWAEQQGDTLYMALYGKEKPPRVTWQHRVLTETPASTETIVDPALPPGTREVRLEGYPGLTVQSSLTIVFSDGREQTKDLGLTCYQPVARVVAVGPQT